MQSTDSIGPYILERELGRGAFGVVHLGHHEDRSDIRLAIKTVPVQGDADRALVEPALLSRLKHPCIVGLEDYFVEDGKLVLALEYIPGEDLKAGIDRGEEFSPEQVRDFLAQMASALAVAHVEQIVHRDIKPSNVLVDSSQGRTRYVLTDFGVGREADGVQSEKHVGGTYLYMAPEQLRGRPSAQSDLWALGVVAYQMLTGKLPFPGPTLNDLSKQIQYGDANPPSEAGGRAVPADLEAVVLRLLNKSLTERFSSAKDLLDALGVKSKSRSSADSTVPSLRKSAVRGTMPLAAKLDQDERRTQSLLVLSILMTSVPLLPVGLVITVLMYSGIMLFHAGQGSQRASRWQRKWLTAARIVILGASTAVNVLASQYTTTGEIPSVQYWLAAQFGAHPLQFGMIYGPLIGLYSLSLTVATCSLFANLRRIRREKTLLAAATGGHAGSDEFLTLMREMVNCRFADVGFHLRYAELLYARGDHRGAAVESRLILIQDPYQFNANLLLANSYYALGLYRDCRDVCDDYLGVTGYSFEFQELRTQCDGRLRRE